VIKVKLSMSAPEWPIFRQTRNSLGTWGDCQFVSAEERIDCDCWVVYDSLQKTEEALCPPENTILITGEPPSVKQYDHRFVAQFGTILTCHRSVDHPNVVFTQTAQPWHVGRILVDGKSSSFSKDYDELIACGAPIKKKLLSVISSNKAWTVGHRRRLRFVEKLATHFGSEIDVFGRGVREINDKWDAIAPYKYHVALENSRYRDYWTEKLSDAFLGEAFPIYYGCPNLTDYFSSDVFAEIDIDQPDEAIRSIERCIREDQYDRSKTAIHKAKLEVLNTYNLFSVIARLAENRPVRSRQLVRLIPESQLCERSLLKRIKGKFGG